MVRVYKYEIDPYGITELTERFFAILKVGWQHEKLYIWALVDDTKVQKKITFMSIPTGYEFEWKSDMTYLDTVQDGLYVWHIFYSLYADTCSRRMH